MTPSELRTLQAPLKEKYKADPASALVTMHASAVLDSEGVSCRIVRRDVSDLAGLHPAAGGSGAELCSGDMLLEALVACSGVTLRAVATAMDIALKSGEVRAEGDVDFRGTLGVDKTAPVGFKAIRLTFKLDTDTPQEKVEQLIKLTERYCVVYQTLRMAPGLSTSLSLTS